MSAAEKAIYKENWASHVKARMVRIGMSQSELARRFGCSLPRMSILLNGDSYPTDETRERIRGLLWPVVDWDNEPRLGTMSDYKLSVIIGCSASAVCEARRRRGVPPAPPETRVYREPHDWDNEGRLGKMTDRELALIIGWSRGTVRRQRTARGIPPFTEDNQIGINWDEEDRLGKMPDPKLAELLGCHHRSVSSARSHRGIPAFDQVCAKRVGVDWNAEDRLGTMPDRALGELLGVSESLVQAARARRGIGSWRKWTESRGVGDGADSGPTVRTYPGRYRGGPGSVPRKEREDG